MLIGDCITPLCCLQEEGSQGSLKAFYARPRMLTTYMRTGVGPNRRRDEPSRARESLLRSGTGLRKGRGPCLGGIVTASFSGSSGEPPDRRRYPLRRTADALPVFGLIVLAFGIPLTTVTLLVGFATRSGVWSLKRAGGAVGTCRRPLRRREPKPWLAKKAHWIKSYWTRSGFWRKVLAGMADGRP